MKQSCLKLNLNVKKTRKLSVPGTDGTSRSQALVTVEAFTLDK